MKSMYCPHCNRIITLQEPIRGSDVFCPKCGQFFKIEIEEQPEYTAPQSQQPPRPPVEPPQATSNSPSRVTVDESFQKVGNIFIGLSILAAILIGLGSTDMVFLFLGGALAGILCIIEGALALSYLRTIALNSERR